MDTALSSQGAQSRDSEATSTAKALHSIPVEVKVLPGEKSATKITLDGISPAFPDITAPKGLTSFF